MLQSDVSSRHSRNEDAYKGVLAMLYGWFGEREKALRLIEELIPKIGKSYTSPRELDRQLLRGSWRQR